MSADAIGLKSDVEMLRSTLGNMLKVGPVEEIDAKKGYRLKLGEGTDGSPYLSPWYPHPETSKTSVPLKKGQIVGVVNPTGDGRQGFLLRGGYSDENASPNENMAANVFEDAGVRVEIADGKLLVTIDGMTLALTGQGIKTSIGSVEHSVTDEGIGTAGGQVVHDGHNIGSTHVHGGVERGGADTFGPH